jgi:ACS family hexuronate transporter-like MFS transporter
MNTQIKNYRWLVVTVIFFASTINYLDRQIIGLLKPILEAEFSWTEKDFSYIIMSFTAAYALGLLLMGRFIDKAGTKIGYAIAVALWSISGMFHALARNALGFAIFRSLLGIGEAGNFPAGMKTVAEWFPKKEQGLAAGIFNAGASVGVILALILVPWILTRYGWKEVFWITGATGLIWLIIWFIFYSKPENQKRLTREEWVLINGNKELEEAPANEKTISWGKLFKMPQTWAVVVGKLLIDPIYWFYLFWLPSYFSTTFQLDLTRLSWELMLIYTATIVGSVGGGYLSSLLIRKGWDVVKARMATLLLFAVIELSVISIQFLSGIWAVVALIGFAAAVHQAWATNVFTLASDMFSKGSVSSVVGIAGMGGALGGILFPLFIGILLDHYKILGNISVGYNIIFTVCGLTYLFAWTIMYVFVRKAKKKESCYAKKTF